MWNLVIPALASLAGGALAGEGGKQAANAQNKAAQDQLNLYKRMYEDQRSLAKPGYMTGGAATNLLAAQYGIGPQNYAAAYGAGGTGADDQWSAYLSSNPDVASEWSRLSTQGKNPFSTPQEYAQYHYQTFGQKEGRQLPQVNQPTDPNMPNGGVSQGGGTSNPLNAFWDSPQGQIATKGFLGVDAPGVAGAFGAGGKSVSGAATKALYDRGQARASGAYNNYLTGLGNLAGMGGSNQLTTIGNNYATNAGNAIGNAGNAKANALSSAYQGWGQGISGAVGAASDYFKRPQSPTDPAKSAYPGYY